MMRYGAGLESGFGFGGLVALLGCALLVAGIVVLVVWVLSRTGRPADAAQVQPTQAPFTPTQAPHVAGGEALEILRVRFARGEITADEYAAARTVLQDGR